MSIAIAFPFAQRLDAGLKLGAVAIEVVRAVVAIGIANVVKIISPEATVSLLASLQVVLVIA